MTTAIRRQTAGQVSLQIVKIKGGCFKVLRQPLFIGNLNTINLEMLIFIDKKAANNE